MGRPRLAALALLLVAAGAVALDVPFLSGRVNDEARIIDARTSASLERTLKDYETRTGRQIVVLTIPSLAGESLEDYSIKVARTWKLGRKGRDDGVLIVVARDDRQLRIEVGYGLEGALPDALAGRIIREIVVPRFRTGEFGRGVDDGVAAVITALDGAPDAARASTPAATRPEAPAAPRPNAPPAPRSRTDLFRSIGALTFGDFCCLAVALLLVMMDADEIRTAGADLGVFVWGAFGIPIFLLPLTKIWGAEAATIPLLVHFLGFPIGKYLMNRTEWGLRHLKKRKGPHRHEAVFFDGGDYSGGGGDYSGGGGFSGGFSGGGGSFGGGGASGSW